MSKHLTGSKRLQVIQNWLNGREDPDWDVLPTKKENKYIVKRREQPLTKPPPEPLTKTETIEEKAVGQNSDTPEEPAEEKPIPKKPIIEEQPKQVYDPTINIEILNQLKLLGEEFKNEKAKKEQKKMIKDVIQKQMRKPYYPQFTQPQYINALSQEVQEPNQIEDESEEEPIPVIPPQPIRRRRNNIFSDMI